MPPDKQWVSAHLRALIVIRGNIYSSTLLFERIRSWKSAARKCAVNLFCATSKSRLRQGVRAPRIGIFTRGSICGVDKSFRGTTYPPNSTHNSSFVEWVQNLLQFIIGRGFPTVAATHALEQIFVHEHVHTPTHTGRQAHVQMDTSLGYKLSRNACPPSPAGVASWEIMIEQRELLINCIDFRS